VDNHYPRTGARAEDVTRWVTWSRANSQPNAMDDVREHARVRVRASADNLAWTLRLDR
jgi:hypothetical protein